MRRDRRPGRGLRMFVTALLLLIAGGLFAALWLQLNQTYSADQARVGTERQALPYLKAAAAVSTELAKARTAAVVGQTATPDGLTTALTALSNVDTMVAGTPSLGQRSAELRAAIEQVKADHPTGRPALDRYGDLLVQSDDQLRSVSAVSQLNSDPQAGVRALVEAVTSHAPSLLAATGRVADLVALPSAPSPDDAVQLAVSRHDIVVAHAALVTSLRTAAETDAGASFVTDAVRRLDQLPAGLAPITDPSRPTSAIPAAAGELRQRIGELTTTMLDELESLLSKRGAQVEQRQLVATATVAAGIAFTLVVLWWSAAPPAPAPADESTGVSGDVATVSVRLPTLDARELLEREELVHVGRGVMHRPSERADEDG